MPLQRTWRQDFHGTLTKGPLKSRSQRLASSKASASASTQTIDRVRYGDNVHRLAVGHHNAHTTGFECQLGSHDLQGNIGPTGSFVRGSRITRLTAPSTITAIFWTGVASWDEQTLRHQMCSTHATMKDATICQATPTQVRDSPMVMVPLVIQDLNALVRIWV